MRNRLIYRSESMAEGVAAGCTSDQSSVASRPFDQRKPIDEHRELRESC